MPNINSNIDIISIVRANTISILVRKKKPIEVLIISDRIMTVARLLQSWLSMNKKMIIDIIDSTSNEISIPNIRYIKIFITMLLIAHIDAQIPSVFIKFPPGAFLGHLLFLLYFIAIIIYLNFPALFRVYFFRYLVIKQLYN